MTRLAGRRAIVTGASRGIGRAVAEALEAEGAEVVRVARSLGCDCTRPDDVAALADRVGTPDVLVNNAGAFLLKPLADTSPEEFRLQLEANTLGPFLMLRAFLPRMVAAGRGHVITVGSIADDLGLPGNAAYGASKWGLRGLHEVARAEAAGSGVRFTLVSPGPTDTALWDAVDPDTRDDLPDRAAMMRADDVADAVRFVATRPAGANVDVLRINPHA